jgi:hypothetical protein
MITINPFNTNQVNENQDNEKTCLICHDNLCYEPCYTLECNHEYHIDCIVSWFRSGNVNCPYCNSKPQNVANNETDYYYLRSDIKNKYVILKRYSKNKDFPKSLKNKIETITKNENKLKELKNAIKDIKNEVGTYSEIMKKHKKTRSQIWKKTADIYNMKRNLLSMVNIVPLTIIKTIKKNAENITIYRNLYKEYII